jgi:predicted enzyme related to lactoylglutathione lyase
MHWPADQPGARDWFAYIKVDNIDKLVADVEAGGGTLIRPVFPIEGVGRIALVMDAAKSAIGFCEPVAMPA